MGVCIEMKADSNTLLEKNMSAVRYFCACPRSRASHDRSEGFLTWSNKPVL